MRLHAGEARPMTLAWAIAAGLGLGLLLTGTAIVAAFLAMAEEKFR